MQYHIDRITSHIKNAIEKSLEYTARYFTIKIKHGPGGMNFLRNPDSPAGAL